MNKMRFLVLVLIASLFSACATIPQESVNLSAEVGVGLKKQYQSQIELINLHFSVERRSLDEALEKALSKYFEELTQSGTVELNRAQLQDVATDIMDLNAKNNAAKEELEKVRVLLIKKLDENYLALNLANSSVTGLLQSAVTVKEARSEAFQALSKATEGKIDLEKVFTELDDFVLKGGEQAGKGIKLVDKVKTLLNEGREETEK